MERSDDQTAKAPLRRALLAAGAALALAVPSAGLAVAGLGVAGLPDAADGPAFDLFTPTSVDPELAARVAAKARERGIRFTPAGTGVVNSERTVTVAVRIDEESVRAMAVRTPDSVEPGAGAGLAAIQSSRFNLGTARGYRSFARPQAASASGSGALATIASGIAGGIEGGISGVKPAPSGITLPGNVRRLSMRDLSEFEPSRGETENEPSRLQPRIALEDERITGRSPNTLDSLGPQTVDVGGSFRLSRNLDVTAGVRLSQERERLDPVANSVQDSQAVYVGTQIRF